MKYFNILLAAGFSIALGYANYQISTLKEQLKNERASNMVDESIHNKHENNYLDSKIKFEEKSHEISNDRIREEKDLRTIVLINVNCSEIKSSLISIKWIDLEIFYKTDLGSGMKIYPHPIFLENEDFISYDDRISQWIDKIENDIKNICELSKNADKKLLVSMVDVILDDADVIIVD